MPLLQAVSPQKGQIYGNHLHASFGLSFAEYLPERTARCSAARKVRHDAQGVFEGTQTHLVQSTAII